MPVKEKIERNEAYVLLSKLGFSYHKLCKVFGRKDKRNIKLVVERDWDKYELPNFVKGLKK